MIFTMIIGLSASAITILAFFGSTWWVLDFLANYRWQLMWIALLCAIIYALSARGLASLVFLGAVVINGFVLSPLWFGSQPTATGEGGATVVSLSESPLVPGLVVSTDVDDGVLVAAGEGAVAFAEVQPPGKRRMSAADWINGRGVETGQLFRGP